MVSKRYEYLDNILSFEIEIDPDDMTPGWTREGILFRKTKWETAKLTC